MLHKVIQKKPIIKGFGLALPKEKNTISVRKTDTRVSPGGNDTPIS
jgi:hypothetical protein